MTIYNNGFVTDAPPVNLLIDFQQAKQLIDYLWSRADAAHDNSEAARHRSSAIYLTASLWETISTVFAANDLPLPEADFVADFGSEWRSALQQ